MRASNIETIIQDVIYQKTKCKSVLIDGDWGCGKTTAIKQAIKNISKNHKRGEKRIYYQSLYGIKEVSELTACYSKIGKIIYSVGKSVATPFTSLIPIVGNQISESIDNTTALFEPDAKQKKNCVFIFDDLERVDPSLSYISLLGFFNQLLLRGCILICVSSLNDLEKIKLERKQDLDAFIEKAFDRIFYINESPTHVIRGIFKNLGTSLITLDNCEPMFENNIRLAIKTQRLLTDINTNSTEKMYVINKKFSELQILKAAICAVRSIYLGKSQVDEVEIKEPKPKIKNLVISEMHNASEKRIRKALDNEISKHADFYDFEGENFEVRELSRCFCWADVYNDYSELQKSYPAEIYEDKKSAEYIGSIFYLSDKDKAIQFKAFNNSCINNDISIDRVFADELMDIIRFGDFNFADDGFEDIIAERVSTAYVKGNQDAFKRIEDYTAVIRTEKNGDSIKKIIDKCRNKIIEKQISNLDKEISEIFSSGNYNDLSNLLDRIKRNNESAELVKSFKKHLVRNDFFLPDLSETITYGIWHYCHNVAKYSADDEFLKDAFIEVLKQAIKKHSDSVSAIDRAKALIEFNFPAETYLTFCDQIEK